VPKAEIRQTLSAEEYRQHEHYAIGQALIAAHEGMSQPDLEVEKGGAARIRYVTGGVTDWMHVLRVNRKTLGVLRWSHFGGGSWYEDKIARRVDPATLTAFIIKLINEWYRLRTQLAAANEELDVLRQRLIGPGKGRNDGNGADTLSGWGALTRTGRI
jgi:hypothetical protein